MAGVAFAVDGDGVGFATESYAASALYTTLANLSGAFWRIRRASEKKGFCSWFCFPLSTGEALHAMFCRLVTFTVLSSTFRARSDLGSTNCQDKRTRSMLK